MAHRQNLVLRLWVLHLQDLEVFQRATDDPICSFHVNGSVVTMSSSLKQRLFLFRRIRPILNILLKKSISSGPASVLSRFLSSHRKCLKQLVEVSSDRSAGGQSFRRVSITLPAPRPDGVVVVLA